MKCNNSYEKHRKKRNKNCLQPERVPGIINVRPDTSDTAQGLHSSRNWRQFYYKAIWRILQCLQKKKPRSCPPWQIRGFYAWRQRDSNPRPLRCERNALPAELCPHLCKWFSQITIDIIPRLKKNTSIFHKFCRRLILPASATDLPAAEAKAAGPPAKTRPACTKPSGPGKKGRISINLYHLLTLTV